MTDNTQLEITFLKQAVEKQFARRLATSADFAALSEDLEESLSPSTLKRLWGYVGMEVEPRTSTLDVLSRYVGYRDWRAFRAGLLNSSFSSSAYFNSERIDSQELQPGDVFQIGWRPDRIVTLKYLGNQRFRVDASENSKLQVGDEFTVSSIVKGFTLIIPEIVRGGEVLSSYIAGREGGIIFIKKS